MKNVLIMFVMIISSFCLVGQSLDDSMIAFNDPFTEISFDFESVNFGTISQGEKVKVVYTINNIGNEPLILYNVKGSCGCTVPEWPKDPILPGESTTFTAIFDSQGKIGDQAKRITLTANTEPMDSYLSLFGKVVEKKSDSNKKDYVRTNAAVPEDLFSVFPNPANTTLNIDYTGGNQSEIKIFDSIGNEILNDKVLSSKQIDVSNFQNGVYSILMSYDGGSYLSKQFIIQR